MFLPSKVSLVTEIQWRDSYVRKAVMSFNVNVILPEKHRKKTNVYLRDRRENQSILLNPLQKEREVNYEVVYRKSLPSFPEEVITVKGSHLWTMSG